MKIKELTLTNDFHNTTATLMPSKVYENEYGLFARVSWDDWITANFLLCGMKDCSCVVEMTAVDDDEKQYSLNITMF